MSKNRIILAVGIVLVLNPLVGGFPSGGENAIYLILGLVLIFLSFSVSIKRRTASPRLNKAKKTPAAEPFVDGFNMDAKPKLSDEPTLTSPNQSTAIPTNNEQ